MDYRFLRFPDGKGKAVTLSYDDGTIHDMKLSEIINRYGLKCTFNLNSERLLSGNGLTVEQAKKLLSHGHEVAIHGARHKASGLASSIDGIRDILVCREVLEQTFGQIIRGMAYPGSGIRRFCNGQSYETVRSYLTDLGIVYSRTLGEDNDDFELPTDWLAWMPTAHHNNPRLKEYMEKFVVTDTNACYCARRHPCLFYLWGHSYEFYAQNNWEVLENIGETLGGRDDIWYATNIDIYEYVTAYHSLICSADGRRVYNPTLIPVWFIDDTKTYCVRSGETLTLE